MNERFVQRRELAFATGRETRATATATVVPRALEQDDARAD